MAQTINLLKTGGAAQLPAPGGGGNGPAASTGNGHASTNGGGNGQSGTAVPAATRCVYLAECSYDRREAREILEAELRLHGCTVLPDQRMPADEADYVTAVQEQLERSELSIHIVGSAYGAVPDGPSGKSTVVLQNELAIGRSRSAGLRRLIWLPTSTQSQQQDQQQFIDSLHNDADAQFGADLITGDLETLKGAVHAAFAAAVRKQAAKSRPEKADGLTPLVYLICDKRDRTETLPLRRYLIDQGMDVEIPVFEGNAAAVRQAHNDLLTQCDAVVVHYGAGDEVWRRTVVNDLRKLRSIRERPLRHIFTYLGLPASEDKDELTKLGDPNYLDGRNGFTESLLDPLVDRFR
jgi:hypothetical protein